MRTTSVPYSQFMEDVLEIYSFRSRKTIAKMAQVLREFGALVTTMPQLKPATIAKWRKAHPDRAPGTVHSLLRSFRAAIEIGIASGYLTASPLIPQVWPELPNPDEVAEKYHTLAEIRAVLGRLQALSGAGWHEHRLYALAATVAYTGLRRNEALYLTIPDVDLTARCIRVVARRKLKTRASAQPVGLPDELAVILEPWIPRTGAIWVFPGATRRAPWTGGPPGYKPLDRLKAEGLAAGVPGFTFLSLRHSWATHAEWWGLGDTMIQRQLRHTTRKTQDHYRHADVANIAASVRSISFEAEVARRSVV
jgi:integrase